LPEPGIALTEPVSRRCLVFTLRALEPLPDAQAPPGPVWTLLVVCPRQQSLACCPAAPQLPHCIATMRQETVPAPRRSCADTTGQQPGPAPGLPAVARQQVAARHTGAAL